jgi:hypothetical protein
MTNSKSPTHRERFSIEATTSRVSSHPAIWHLAAKAFWLHPFRNRNLRTCGPTAFRGRGDVSDTTHHFSSPKGAQCGETHTFVFVNNNEKERK